MLGLLLAALFILLNGFFVAAEFAFVKLHATQSILEARIKRKERSAIHAKMVLERLDSFLSVTQFGVTLASLGLVEPEKTDHAEPEDILASVAEKERRILEIVEEMRELVTAEGE